MRLACLLPLLSALAGPVSAQNYGPQQRLTRPHADGASSVYTADLDGDGDVDVIAASANDHTIAWYEQFSRRGLGERYCSPAIANSTNSPGILLVYGNEMVAENDITLVALQLPRASFGVFLTSETPGLTYPIVGSQGALCLAGFLGHFYGPGQIQSSGVTGSLSLTIELMAMPNPTGFVPVQPGETWHFQVWHRDENPTATSSFTDAVGVTFR